MQVELQEFVATALKQILEGVQDAQRSVNGDGEVNPNIWERLRGAALKQGIFESNSGRWIHMVDFDVAVSVGEETGKKAGGGIVVAAIGLGAQGQSRTESATVSRIRFSVPVAFPTGRQAAEATEEQP